MRSLDCVKVLTRLWGSGLGPCDGQGLLDRGCRHTHLSLMHHLNLDRLDWTAISRVSYFKSLLEFPRVAAGYNLL
jgi:hypothetical protein